jgi:hypothetical protein
MRRLSLVCAAGLALTALAASGPAKAAPFQVIRWDNTGICQVWDQTIAITPWLSSYKILSKPTPTFAAAFDAKEAMVKQGQCRL